jgi:serine/threonine-protein kinase
VGITDTRETLQEAVAGSYVIDRELGRGGMAIVYLAEDVRHQRRVAVKVLRPELAQSLGAERFLREIGLVARLAHPHILPLHESGEVDGLLYYVTPYIEGESLRGRLERERQLPVDEAVRLAREVADALAYAHAHEVVHRDIKPENILLQAGHALVADFGIARAVTEASAGRLTETGLAIGTPAYMSPEQAAGERDVDARSDVYSLGSVLYEMLAGDPPFAAPTAQGVVARVLTEEPRPLTLARPTVPPYVADAVRRAMAKLPADRFSSAAAFAAALSPPGVDLHAAPLGATAARPVASPAVTTRQPRLRAAAPWLVAAFAIAVAVGAVAWALRRARAAEPQAPVRFALAVPASERPMILPQGLGGVAISADGRTLAYIGAGGSSQQVFVRSLGELQSRAVPGTEGVNSVAFSPDGTRLLVLLLGQFKIIPLRGGSEQLSTLPQTSPPQWADDEHVLLSEQNGVALFTLATRERRKIARPDSAHGETMMGWPRLTRDGRTLLYSSVGPDSQPIAGRIAALDLLDGSRRVLTDDRGAPVDVIDGKLLYWSADQTLTAAPFDAARLRLTGTPVPVLRGVRYASVAANGTLAYIARSPERRVVLLDRRGAPRDSVLEVLAYGHPRYSPDARRLAFDAESGPAADIWVRDVVSGTRTRLTTAATNVRPEWTPDGRVVAYIAGGPRATVYERVADGSAPAERLAASSRQGTLREIVFAPDARTAVLREDTYAGSKRNLLLLDLTAGRTMRPLVATPADELSPRVSPDGHWLAYISDESGRYEVYVQPFPGLAGRWQVSVDGGTEPLWSRDGRELFYRSGDQVIAAAVRTSPAFAVTGRQVLFEGPYARDFLHPMYDVSPDGKTFVMLRPAATEAQIVVVLDWLAELRARLAAAR